MQYQSRNHLKISFEHLFTNSKVDEPIIFSIDLMMLLCLNPKEAEQFATRPSQYLKNLRLFMLKQIKREGSLENEIKYHNTSIRLKSIPYILDIYKKFHQISSKDIGQWMIVTGTIVQFTHKKALEKSKIFVCNECGAQYRLENNYQNYYRFQLSFSCSNFVQKEQSANLFTKFYQNMKNKSKSKDSVVSSNGQKKLKKCGSKAFSGRDEQKVWIDYQELKIQEQFKHISAGKLPQTLTIIVEGGLEDNFRPGDDITVSGILDYRFKKPGSEQKVQMQMVLLANNITIQKSYTAKENDRESLYEESQNTEFPVNFYNEFSLASRQNIIIKQLQFRNFVIKKFCPNIFGRQLVKLGLILSLLGGVSYQNENSKIRGQSHILLIGQPGTGKSVLIKQAASLAERSFFTNGIGSSSAGLSVCYYKDGGDWMIEPGALVLADNGVCCIDQLTLLAKKEENSLLQAMEQQTISSAKASVVGKLNARTTVICACNPITPGQKYDSSLDLEVNTGISIPLLTRFDLILILKDESGRYEDSMKCDHILEKFRSQEQFTANNLRDQFSLKSYLKKCKVFQPELKNAEILTKYYACERKNTEKVTTARTFQSLCRLSEAHAKLMMRDSTEQFDCLTAIMMTENNCVSTLQQYEEYLNQFHEKYLS